MKFNFPMNNFISGEWSPKMRARNDAEQFPKACETLENMLVSMHGGAYMRGGFSMYNLGNQGTLNALDLDSATFKLLPYLPSASLGFAATFVLIASNSKWYTMPDGAELTKDGSTSLSGWIPENTCYYQQGDFLFITDTSGTYSPKILYYSTADSAYHVQDYASAVLIPSAFIFKMIPYGSPQANDISVELTYATAGGTKVTSNINYFTANHVGMYIRLCSGSSVEGIVKIGSYTDAKTVGVTSILTPPLTVGSAYGGTAAPDTFWQISDWGNAPGWPKFVTGFEGRLIFASTKNDPKAVYGSRIGNVGDFCEVPSPDTTGALGFADSAYANDNSRPFKLTPTFNASTVTALSSSKTLNVHMDTCEIVAHGNQGALGPNDVTFESSTSFGAEVVQPVRVNNFTTFVQAGGRKLRDLIFNFMEDQYKSNDLAFVADHLFLSNFASTGVDAIAEMAKTEGASSILWCRTQLGKLLTLTLDRDYQVNAWSHHVVGNGTYSGDGATVKAICSLKNYAIPDALNKNAFNEDALFAIIVRKLHGTNYFCMEKLSPAWETADPVASPDQGAVIDYAPQYLDGQRQAHPFLGSSTVWNANFDLTFTWATYANIAVSVMADGVYIGEYTTDSSAHFTLDAKYASSAISVGFKYTGTLKTFPIEQGGAAGGSPSGRQKRIDEMVLKFYNTGAGVYFGADINDLLPVSPGATDTLQPLFTGSQVVSFPGDYERELQVIVQQTLPYPFFIAGVIPRGMTYD